MCDKRTFLSRSSRLDAAEWSLVLAVSPVTCRLHSKGPRVLNLHSNGACSLGWTTYTTIVSALAAASDHGFSCCLCFCLHAPRDDGTQSTMRQAQCHSRVLSKELRSVSCVVTCQIITLHPTRSRPPYRRSGFDHSSQESSLMQASHCGPNCSVWSQGYQDSLLCLKTLFLLF